MTKPQKRKARRRTNGELLRVFSTILFPIKAVRLVSARGHAVFDQEVALVEPTEPDVDTS